MLECLLIHFKEISADLIPLSLLLIADPSEIKISEYLEGSICFGAYVHNELVTVCVTNSNGDGETEIFNIASLPNMQQNGTGSKLLEFVINEFAKRKVKKLVLGSGAFGYHLTFYQRLGFRVESVVKDFFTENYDEPIYENGIQHHDMLRLVINL